MKQENALKAHIPKGFRSALLKELFCGLKRWVVLAAVSAAAAIITSYLTPILVSFAVDSVLGDLPPSLPSVLNGFGERLASLAPTQALWWVAGAIVAVNLLNALFSYLRGHSLAFLGEGFAKKLRDQLFAHLQNVPFSYYSGAQTGDLIQRCTTDVDMVRRFIQMQLIQMLRTIGMAITAVAVMLPISPQMTLISCCLMPFLALFSFVYFRRVQNLFLKADEAEGAMSTMLQEDLTGMRVVRAFAQQKAELERFTAKNQHYHNSITKLTSVMGAYWGLSDMAGYLQIALSLCCGVYFCVQGSFTVGNVLLFTTYTSMLTFPMRQLGRILADLGKADVSLTRLEDILCTPEEAEPGKALCPEIDGSVSFEHVSFDYGEGEVLHDISFSVQPGQTVGILGSTGSGKSTLVHLLQRHWTAGAGHITLSGVDVNDIERHHLRQNVGLVLQEPFLYSRTIGENIAIARRGASQSEIFEAARTASLHDVIQSFSEGYETVVGERGVTLSGGQKQRVAIARTLLQNAPIMIFDDSLSAVDAQTDAAIRDALTAKKDCTMFLISHRIATVRRADLILVMDGGRIVQRGTHETLCREEGMYRRVCALQNELDEAQEGGALHA